MNPEEVNVTRSHDKVVKYLSKINKRAKGEEITLPVNTVPHVPNYGMVSYPNFGGPCRSLNYPNLDHFYHACDVAGVECKHAYIYRDPYSVLASTTLKRKMNQGNFLQGIHLYTSLLQIIYSQLVDHSDRTVGALAFSSQLFRPLRFGILFETCLGGRTKRSLTHMYRRSTDLLNQ
jgi:hypothetical protein